MGLSGRFTHGYVIFDYIGLFGIGLYLGRASRTKETLPDFRESCRVSRHSQVFSGLTGSQRTPRFWGVIDQMATHGLISHKPFTRLLKSKLTE